MEVVFTQQMSKVKQLADAISHAISRKEFKEGEPLPTINQLSVKYSVSRDTVFKAFKELKAKGIVDSAPTKGYYVCNPVHHILLLLDTYSLFKYELHKALSKNLPYNYKVDLYFHQYDEEQYNKIITDSIGRYNSYLVMNFRNDVYSTILNKLDPHKVMLLDFGKFDKKQFSYACQGFDTTLYDCLKSGSGLFSKYNKIVFVFPNTSEHPQSCIPYFEKFCADYRFDYQIKEAFSGDDLELNAAYLIVRHSDLVELVKASRLKGYKLGKDIGAVVFNDEPIFEILDNGITTISADFKEMGVLASKFALTRKKIQTYVPTKLIIRGSL